MKFREALAAARAARDTLPAPERSLPMVGASPPPTVQPMVLFYQGGSNTATPCQVYVTDGLFRDIDVARVKPGPAPYYGGEIRGSTRYPVALPTGVAPTQGQIQYVVKVNGQFWAIAPVSTDCTTTSTTTKPPCACEGGHPDMRLTLSGITAIDPATCDTAYCGAWNKTWCLYFHSGPNGGKSCFWNSDTTTIGPDDGCGLWGSYSGPLSNSYGYPALRMYLVYPNGCGALGYPDPCDCAKLVINSLEYVCTNFDPEAGGTFDVVPSQLESPDSSYDLCANWPASIVVVAASGCTTSTTTTTTTTTSTTSTSTTSTSTTSTTSTTTTTTTSTTTSTTSSTTSTTTPIPAGGTCEYQWNGTSWDFLIFNCTGPGICVPPGYSGTYVGEITFTNCA